MLTLTKQDLLIADICPKDDPVYSLDAVRFEPGRMIATNGHMLAVVDIETDGEFEPFGVTGADLILVRKAMKKADTVELAPPVDGQVTVTIVNGGPVFRFAVSDKSFPTWEKVITSDADTTFRVALDAGYLHRLQNIAGSRGLELSFKAADVQVRVKANDASGRFLGVLMPMMLDEDRQLARETGQVAA